MKVKMVYKKASNSGFITIITGYEKEDEDYVYLECGKYLKKNIASWVVLSDPGSSDEGLTDDA